MKENFRQFLDRLRQAGELVDLHRLYGREYAMEASQGRGFALLRAGRPSGLHFS